MNAPPSASKLIEGGGHAHHYPCRRSVDLDHDRVFAPGPGASARGHAPQLQTPPPEKDGALMRASCLFIFLGWGAVMGLGYLLVRKPRRPSPPKPKAPEPQKPASSTRA